MISKHKENLKSDQQNHLTITQRTNLGSFYTPNELVKLVTKAIEPYCINKNVVILDNSAGYGAFLDELGAGLNIKVNDIDQFAYQKLKSKFNDVYNINALTNVKRDNYQIKQDDFLIIIGNPPYNDRFSYAKQDQKEKSIIIDDKLKSRDLGISFLRSYCDLKADIVCILHPFAYLAKMANFKQLRDFTKQYRLKESVIFSSALFPDTSKKIQFPICMALYIKDNTGMDYNYVKQFDFRILDGTSKFSLAKLNSIANYVNKYPRKEPSPIDLYFFTLRDINALKRNQTFLKQINSGSLPVTHDTLYWYSYIDVFKEFIKELPYYYGNCDVFIDFNEFIKIKESFFMYAYDKNQILALNSYATKLYQDLQPSSINFMQQVKSYFKNLFQN